MGSPIAAADRPWVDYALWRDDSFTGNAGPTAPGGTRGNLRLSIGWQSSVDVWLGRPVGTTIDYLWMVGSRVPAPHTVGQTWPVDGRIS